LLVAALSSPAIASPEGARLHGRRGTALYSAGKYLEASAEFEAAYGERPDAGFLFNAAQAARLGGDLRKAQTLYSSYISFHPDGTSIVEARNQLDLIEAKLKADDEAKHSLAPKTIVVVNPPVTTPARRPIYKRWWLWTAVVGGAAVVGAGVALGVVYGRPAPTWTNVPDLGPGAKTSTLLQLRF
jgi:hypothetical protein